MRRSAPKGQAACMARGLLSREVQPVEHVVSLNAHRAAVCAICLKLAPSPTRAACADQRPSRHASRSHG